MQNDYTATDGLILGDMVERLGLDLTVRALADVDEANAILAEQDGWWWTEEEKLRCSGDPAKKAMLEKHTAADLTVLRDMKVRLGSEELLRALAAV